MTPHDYEFVIVGTGEGSKFLAWTLAKQGKRVAVIERQYIGGSCPNIACLPSKNIIHSAKVASYFARSEEFGIFKEGFRVDMAKVRERKRAMVKDLVKIHLDNFKNSGAELILGRASFAAPQTIEVALQEGGTRVIRSEKIIIGTGTRAAIPDIPGLKASAPMTHIEALELDVVPPHLLILGGGFIGLEFAQAMRRLGSSVTIIDHHARLAHREDDDVAEALHAIVQKEGIELVMEAQVASVEGTSGQAVKLNVTQNGKRTVLEGSHILVAAGRTPNTQNLGLEKIGVQLNAKGFIQVNERLETTAKNVWAIGECAGSPQFTHIAFDDFRVIRENLDGRSRVTTDRQIPFCLFTDPEFARIGLSEKDAKAKGIPYRLAKIPMAADLRTRTLSETTGFMKALVAKESDQLLGFTVVGVDGGEIMGAVQLAMIGKLPFTAIRDAVLTHPTLLEGLVVLFSAVPPPTV